MTSQGASGIPWMPKLTLEDYINLEHLDVISFHALRKILMIHGFKSFKVPKDDLIDAVRSIKLMDVHHSTLQSEGVSSDAFLSLNDVIKDISLLHWHECCITSIETINSVIDEAGQELSPTPLNPNPDYNTASSSKKIHTDPLKVYTKKKKRVKSADSGAHLGILSLSKIKHDSARPSIVHGLPAHEG